MKKSDYQGTLDFLFSQLPMFQRIGAAAYRKDLTNIKAICAALGHPERRFPVIHVAGTNGKGSVCFLLSAILQAAGLKTGLCVSPHYRDFRERTRINGQYVSRAFVVDFTARIRQLAQDIQPSFFEISTAMAFDYFARQKVDVAIIETGMGGRLDSTNIVAPLLSVITNIGFDHTEYLGGTLPLIAGEKAGIIKPGVPVVIGESAPETEPVFRAKATECHAPIAFADKVYHAVPVSTLETHTVFDVYRSGELLYPQLPVNLRGGFQAKNLQTALQAAELLQPYFSMEESHIREGLHKLRALTRFMGRWDFIGRNPAILCDSAHNAAGIATVLSELKSLPFKRLHIVFGMVKDKDIAAILRLLPKTATYYFCKADIPRGLAVEDLRRQAAEAGLHGKAYSSVKNALRAAKRVADKEDLIFVGGSIFVVAEVI
ncbi:MAG: bifunctional folylpolyglutamate synthase/dihydrofolate synthase [Saprospiraceae bacterium]|nr:bifunctional folylpolyglutamate synthase/dihydrofolate synthase [Saprospiraceae bacterium]